MYAKKFRFVAREEGEDQINCLNSKWSPLSIEPVAMLKPLVAARVLKLDVKISIKAGPKMP